MAEANPYIKQYLMAAGATPIPPKVSQVQAEPILYHRAPAFVEIYARVLERLKHVFQTENDVLTFSASGSGGMESAVANLVRPGVKVLVASCGKFGERWAELAEAYGADLVHWDAGWGNRVEPAELEQKLAENDGVEVVYTTLSETSTGVVNDIQALTEVAHDRAAEHTGQGRYYFDWHKTLKGQQKDPPDSPFTPPVSIFMALDVALGMIEEEGLENVFERHRVLGRATRAAVKALDLEIFGPDDENSNVVTAAKLPESIDGGKVPKIMRDKYGITIAGGQNQLKGKIARVAHTGYFGAFDILTTVAGFEMTLRELGHDVELGAGVGAAQAVFLEAGVPAGAPA